MKTRGLVPLVLLLGAASWPARSFQPADLTGLTLWGRADAGVTAGADAKVSLWSDQSGHGNDFRQADPKLQPQLVAAALNGLPALRFDGVADALVLAAPPLPLSGASVFAVVKWDQVRAYSFALGLDAGTDGYLRMSSAFELLTGGSYPVLYQNSLPCPKRGYPSAPDKNKIFCDVPSSLLGFNVFAITDNPPSNEKLKYLGQNELNNEPANRFAGQIAEVLVYNRPLPPAEREQVEEYLEHKYLGWPALTTVPIAAGAEQAQTLATRLAADKPQPVALAGEQGGVLAQGYSQAPLPPGRYRVHAVLDAAASPAVTYSLRLGHEVRPLPVTAGAAAEPIAEDFTQPLGAPLDPVLVRFSWSRAAAGAVSAPETATVRGVYVEALSPVVVKSVAVDKILYAPGQLATVAATLTNSAAEDLSAQVRFSEVTGLDDRRPVGACPVTIPAGGQATATSSFRVSDIQYGRDLLVEVLQDAKVVAANTEPYSVSDNLWKVCVGSPSPGNNADKSDAQIGQELQRARQTYSNWVEVDFWAPDDWGLMVTPPGATWYSGQARRHENTEKLQFLIKAAHDLGMKAITYGKCMAGGRPGWELARTKPQWFLVDSYGHTMGRPADVWDLDHWQEDKYKYHDFRYDWTYRWVDLRLMAPLDHGIDQLIGSAKEFGWDGVRFDSGGFRAYFVGGKFGGLDSYNARNMHYTKERVWKAIPGFLFGYNTDDPVSGEKTGGTCPLTPADPCGHEYREMLAGGGLWMFEGLRDKPDFFGRRTYKTWSDYAQDMVTTVRTIRGYGGQACCSYGDTELYKFIIGTMVGCHDYSGEHVRASGSEDWGRFLTRWSSFLWDQRLRALPDPDNTVAVQSATPLWWKQFANNLVTSPSQRYVIVNLLNPPVHDEVAATKTETPPPVRDCTVTLTVPQGERLVRAWYIAPGHPNQVQELTPRAAGQSATVAVPRLDIWGMVIWELRGAYTVPPAAPALTEPLNAAELAEMDRNKPTPNVPVADNLLNPTPQFDPAAVKAKVFAPSTVTPPNNLPPGQAGRSVLLVNGFYHYTYHLREALQRYAPGVSVQECTIRDLPQDYPDLWRYNVIVLVDVGADAWGANAPKNKGDAWAADGQKRLADFVAAGGRLVVLGGPFTLGQGSFSGTLLESVLPVRVRVARDVYQLPQPLPLGDSRKDAFPGRPLVYYYHAVQAQPDAAVRLWAGELPLWYEHPLGRGSAAVFVATTLGEARQPGEVPFWEWGGWPALAAKLVLGQ